MMEQRIKSVMMEGQKKAPLMVPDTVVYKHGYPSGMMARHVVTTDEADGTTWDVPVDSELLPPS